MPLQYASPIKLSQTCAHGLPGDMCYIFIAPHVKAFIMSTYASLKQMIMRLEPDELDSCHDASDHHTMVNLLHAKEIDFSRGCTTSSTQEFGTGCIGHVEYTQIEVGTR